MNFNNKLFYLLSISCLVNLLYIDCENITDYYERISPQECGIKRDLFNIVGGWVAQPNSYPWTVAIFSRGKFICGGAIVNNYWVITAAHCVMDNFGRVRTLEVKVGAHEIKKDGHMMEVAHIIAHERYRPWGNRKDIALIKLAKRLLFNDKVSPVCLPAKELGTSEISGNIATAVGWGTVKFRGDLSPILLQVELPVIKNEVCAASYKNQLSINNDMLCAGFMEGGKDTCQGDSGGPLIYQRDNMSPCVLIGVVSFGYKCAEKGYPGVYTRVTSYLDWIHSHMK